jgi:hypothetical protein
MGYIVGLGMGYIVGLDKGYIVHGDMVSLSAFCTISLIFHLSSVREHRCDDVLVLKG